MQYSSLVDAVHNFYVVMKISGINLARKVRWESGEVGFNKWIFCQLVNCIFRNLPQERRRRPNKEAIKEFNLGYSFIKSWMVRVAGVYFSVDRTDELRSLAEILYNRRSSPVHLEKSEFQWELDWMPINLINVRQLLCFQHVPYMLNLF